jgi:YD repeat-containing protein
VNSCFTTKTYDAISRLLTASTSVSAHAYVYDAANQLLSETTTIPSLASYAVTYAYDLNGNRNRAVPLVQKKRLNLSAYSEI